MRTTPWLISLVAPCILLTAQSTDSSQYAFHLRQAEQMLSAGDPSSVIQTLKAWPQKFPQRPEAHHFLGLAYYQLKDFPNAIKHLSEALPKENEGSEAWKQTVEVLGAAHYFNNEWKEAAPLLEKASAWQPENSDLLYTLAMSYLFTRNSAGARETFAKIFGLEAESPQGYLLTADLLRKESLESDAEVLILEARRKWPEFRGVAFRAGAVAFSKGDHSQAASLFREELKRYPGEPASWHALGEALVSSGQPAEASEALKRAIWLDARWTPSYILLAKLYMDASRYTVAEDTLKQALKSAPQSYEANFLLSRLYQKTGRPELAKQQWAIAEKIRR